MNITSLLNSATMGHPERVRPMIWWTILEYFLRGAPYGILLVIVWEVFKPLEQPGAALNIPHIVCACIALAVLLVILYVVNRKSYFAAYKDSYEICADGRVAMAEHLRGLPMGFYNSRDPGDIGAYLVNDYANIEVLLSHLLPQFYGALAAPAAVLVCLAFFCWKLALAAALVIPLAWPMALISYRIIDYFGKKHQKTRINAASRMIEYIQGIRLIKAFNLGGLRFHRLEKAFRHLKTQSIRLESGAGPTLILASFVLNSGFTLIILYGFALLASGQLSLAVYTMFLIAGSRVYEPLLHALMFLGEINYMKLGVDRVENLRQTSPLPQKTSRKKMDGFDIDFQNVTFRYHDTDVLKNISLTIAAKSLTALVGPSGSGKTTMTRLIARFWDADKGDIRIGGRSVRAFNADDLMSRISMVFQDVYLFNDTIYNNIRIGRPQATRREVMAAAKKARCHDFINALPEKYETLVGEGGNTLSGGEKQRISIARAMLKDAPIVLLDEATASLDPENELFIQEAIDDLVKNKTVVVIAHRLNTIVRADKILVMDKGCIVEQGLHRDLIEKKGLYHHLWQKQQQIKGWKF